MSATQRSTARTSHVERTAAEPRDNSLHKVVVSRISQVNNRIRVLQLAIPDDKPPIKFLPGQWLDVFVPSIPKPGGFTITSPPSTAQPSKSSAPNSNQSNHDGGGYLELAIQESPQNPPAAWLWRPTSEIIGQELKVRIGGSFVWPPQGTNLEDVKRVVFVAGGVGINPLMSIVSHLAESRNLPYKIRFIYSVREPTDTEDLSSILFLERLSGMFAAWDVDAKLVLHLTPREKDGQRKQRDGIVEMARRSLSYCRRRFTNKDLMGALGPVDERRHTVCYICGVPSMTDKLVLVAQQAEGMDPRKVFFERWW